MADIIQDAIAYLADTLNTHAGQTITYRRGADEVEIQATIGESNQDLDDGSGVIDRWESRDYLVLAADLVLNGVTIEPAAGDEIDEGGVTYKVFAPPGLAVVQDDGFGYWLQVHTWKRAAN